MGTIRGSVTKETCNYALGIGSASFFRRTVSKSWDNYVSERRANCYIWVNNFMRHFSEGLRQALGNGEDELDVNSYAVSLEHRRFC